MKHKKKLNKYIKENQNKGYSLEQIKKAFITYGYDPDFAANLIRNYKTKNIIIKTSPVILILLLLMPFIFFYNSGITTLAVATKQHSFTDDIYLTFDESTDYIWNLENKGILKAVKLNGEVKINGTVKIYLEYENKSYLIFDNKKLEEGGLEQITGFVTSVDNIKVQTEGNLTSEAQVIIDNLIIDINETKNNVEIEIEVKNNKTKKEIIGNLAEEQNLLINTLMNILNSSKENVKIKIESEFEEIEIPEEIINETIENKTLINDTINITLPLNETNVTVPMNDTINITPINITNETIINETIENVSVNIKLEYKEDSIYDKNNDGIENINNIIDLTVENTKFNFDVKEENLCTRWDTYSVEDDVNTLVCYGSSQCCNFVDLLSSNLGWDETLFLSYGQYGATLNNFISAQVLYVDYNLSLEDPYSEIYYSDWKNLTAQFYEQFVSFEDICIETCVLPNLNATSYKLTIKVNDSSLRLDSINYIVALEETKNNPPVLLANFSNIRIFEDQSYAINLSKHFYDADNDTLTFNSNNNSDISISIINDTATLKPVDFTGKTYLFFIANDSIDITISNIFEVEVKKRNILASGLKSLRQLIKLI